MRILCAMLFIALTGCASLRDARLDHRLPPAEMRTIDLARYKSVQSRSDGQQPDLAIAAAISGGGHRAANFAVGVFMALESLTAEGHAHDVLKEIDYFSTVSGGGFAAGAYISTLHDYIAHSGHSREDYSFTRVVRRERSHVTRSLRKDYHGTIMGALLCIDCLGHADAGDLFERKIDRLVLGSAYRPGHYSLRLGHVFKYRESEEDVLLPYWAANATIFENGMRFPFTPDVLEHYGVAACTHKLKKLKLRGRVSDMPLAVGAKASASFPVAFPATTLVCKNADDQLNPYLHLLDGGLADNIGYQTAIDFLRQDSAKHKVLLIIDAYKGISHPYSSSERSPSGAGVAYRITKIGLDADRGLLDRNINRLVRLAAKGENGEPIHVITLSFAELKPVLSAKIGDIKQELSKLRKTRAAAVARRLQREIDIVLRRKTASLRGAEGSFELYDDVRAVATSLNISAGEQQILFKAGAAAVQHRLDVINKYIVSNMQAGGR